MPEPINIPPTYAAGVAYHSLVPPDVTNGAEYVTGVGVFFHIPDRPEIYVLTLDADSARRLANDITAHYDGNLPLRKPVPNPGE